MANWQAGIGGATSGASIGAQLGSIIPGLGNVAGGAIGGIAGGLLGLLGGDTENPQYHDPYEAQINAMAKDLMSGKQGQQLAANSSAKVMRNARLEMDDISNAPGVAGNLAVRSRLLNKIQNQAEQGIVDANLAGMQVNQQNRQQAAGLLQGQQQFKFGVNQYNQQMGDRPSLLESIGQYSLGELAGGGLSNLMYGSGNSGGQSAPQGPGAPPTTNSSNLPLIAQIMQQFGL